MWIAARFPFPVEGARGAPPGVSAMAFPFERKKPGIFRFYAITAVFPAKTFSEIKLLRVNSRSAAKREFIRA
jgi:hypothetical protein